MIDLALLDQRPIVVAIAGPNGAGKSTFFNAHLAPVGLHFVEADRLAMELGIDPYAAAELASKLRDQLVRSGESFVFETVFSDPVGDKLAFLKTVEAAGYAVVLCFIGLPDAETSVERVAMRVTQGGHDVPDEKLTSRYPRVLANLRQAVRTLPLVLIFDNGDLTTPFRRVAVVRSGDVIERSADVPPWLEPLLPPSQGPARDVER